MKICVISDLHGFLPELESDIDLLLICGDISPLKIQGKRSKCKEWFENEFKNWINSYNIKETVFIAGNHDFYLKYPDFNLGDNIHYLLDEQIEINGLKIYGTPRCKQFGNWVFMGDQDTLNQYFNKIPEGLDILLTHDSPYGVSDVILEKDCRWYSPDHIGSMALTEAIQRTQPKYVFHGHLHSTNHDVEMLGNSEVRCVSILNEKYEYFYKPYYFEINA